MGDVTMPYKYSNHFRSKLLEMLGDLLMDNPSIFVANLQWREGVVVVVISIIHGVRGRRFLPFHPGHFPNSDV